MLILIIKIRKTAMMKINMLSLFLFVFRAVL